METGKLVVLGSINADHILNIEQFPHPGETVIGKQYKVAFGGKGANQAVAAGRSGADIAFIACVGATISASVSAGSWRAIALILNRLKPSPTAPPAWR